MTDTASRHGDFTEVDCEHGLMDICYWIDMPGDRVQSFPSL